jgi:hypothetical protein
LDFNFVSIFFVLIFEQQIQAPGSKLTALLSKKNQITKSEQRRIGGYPFLDPCFVEFWV